MLVNLKYDWFSPGYQEVLTKETKNGVEKIIRARSGRLYKQRHNPHDMSEDMLQYLPKSAKIVDKYPEPEVEVSQNFKDFDEARIAAETEEKVLSSVQQRMAKAREAIGKK